MIHFGPGFLLIFFRGYSVNNDSKHSPIELLTWREEAGAGRSGADASASVKALSHEARSSIIYIVQKMGNAHTLLSLFYDMDNQLIATEMSELTFSEPQPSISPPLSPTRRVPVHSRLGSGCRRRPVPVGYTRKRQTSHHRQTGLLLPKIKMIDHDRC